jgi:hypothetical protein
MKMDLPEVRPEERTPLVDSLLVIIRQLLDRVQQLEESVQQLRDENAILKGQKPRPQISPSRLESPTPVSRPKDGKRPGSDKRSKNSLSSSPTTSSCIATIFFLDRSSRVMNPTWSKS